MPKGGLCYSCLPESTVVILVLIRACECSLSLLVYNGRRSALLSKLLSTSKRWFWIVGILGNCCQKERGLTAIGGVKGLWWLADMLWVGRCCQKKRILTAMGYMRWFVWLKDMLWDGNGCQKRRILTANPMRRQRRTTKDEKVLNLRDHGQ